MLPTLGGQHQSEYTRLEIELLVGLTVLVDKVVRRALNFRSDFFKTHAVILAVRGHRKPPVTNIWLPKLLAEGILNQL